MAIYRCTWPGKNAVRRQSSTTLRASILLSAQTWQRTKSRPVPRTKGYSINQERGAKFPVFYSKIHSMETLMEANTRFPNLQQSKESFINFSLLIFTLTIFSMAGIW